MITLCDQLNTLQCLTSEGQVAWQWLITGFGEANPTTGATKYSQSGQTSASYAVAVKFDLRYLLLQQTKEPTTNLKKHKPFLFNSDKTASFSNNNEDYTISALDRTW